ncbi:MAG: hypothetical protein A2167_05080 [Planctomycetes bacterium RBG_13_46_10]|nr:MAG: hypothetical protein A2167_05080 [Planctomycetes bacterium RBG_13_46_10]
MIDEHSEIQIIENTDAALFDLTDKFGHDAPLKRIFQIVLAQGCSSILIEKDYDEEEWKQEHKIFYGKLFRKYSEKCDRLHFFSSNVNSNNIPSIEKLQDNYLGFCVLRPVPARRVVNSVIKPLEERNNPPKSFIICQEKFAVQIDISNGDKQTLCVTGFPFMQQDKHAGCCAHAGLIMAERFLVQRRNIENPGSDEQPHLLDSIRETLVKIPGVGRKLPTPGLRPIDISTVLEESMKYSPLVYVYSKDNKPPFALEKMLYHYLESKIPVQLLVPTECGGHSLTVIGHSFDPDVWWALAREPYYLDRPLQELCHCSTNWIEHFIVQDDNFGPYPTVPKSHIRLCEISGQSAIAVPLPLNVNIEGPTAELIATYCIANEINVQAILAARDNAQISGNTWKLFLVMWSHFLRRDLVLRTFLVDSDEFKNSYVPAHLKQYYDPLKLYKKIWLTEISIPELFSQTRKRLGEILIDPTAPPPPLIGQNLLPDPQEAARALLAIHVPGFIGTRDVDVENLTTNYILDDNVYSHIIRKTCIQ